MDPSCLAYSTESQEEPGHTDILYTALFSKVGLLFTSLEAFDSSVTWLTPRVHRAHAKVCYMSRERDTASPINTEAQLTQGQEV